MHLCMCVCVHSAWWKSCFDILFKNTSPLRVIIMSALFISLFWRLTISIRAAAFCPWPNSGSHTHVRANRQTWGPYWLELLLPPSHWRKRKTICAWAPPTSHCVRWVLFAFSEGFPATRWHMTLNLFWCEMRESRSEMRRKEIKYAEMW